MIDRRFVGIAAMTLFGAGCLGGQSAQTKAESAAAGDRSGGVPAATKEERDWKAAASGHGTAAAIPRSELADMERKSAPGANLGADGGS